jgi:hypothetical protein
MSAAFPTTRNARELLKEAQLTRLHMVSANDECAIETRRQGQPNRAMRRRFQRQNRDLDEKTRAASVLLT